MQGFFKHKIMYFSYQSKLPPPSFVEHGFNKEETFVRRKILVHDKERICSLNCLCDERFQFKLNRTVVKAISYYSLHIFHKHFLFSRIHSSVQYISVVTRQNTTLAPKNLNIFACCSPLGKQVSNSSCSSKALTVLLSSHSWRKRLSYCSQPTPTTKLGHRLTFYIGGS